MNDLLLFTVFKLSLLVLLRIEFRMTEEKCTYINVEYVKSKRVEHKIVFSTRIQRRTTQVNVTFMH